MLMRGRRHPWADPGRIIVAGQSNAIKVMQASPAPQVPSGREIQTVAIGGTSLYADWQFGQQYMLREALINAVSTAPLDKPVAILWIQGESDQDKDTPPYSLPPVGSTTYVADFTALYNDVNGSRTDVLWVMALISANTRYQARCPIRLNQEQLVRTLRNIEPVNTDGYGIQYDAPGEDGMGVHYSNASAVECWQTALAIFAAR